MKNREKFRDEIKTAIETGTTCAIIRNFVRPKPLDLSANEFCEKYNCYGCSNLFAFWLDEEYVEPQKPAVDWSKVPVDTLVRVRDYENCEWGLRYFKGFDKSNPEEKYEAWSNGATSKTANDNSNHWKYCELVEDEDGSN